MFRLLTSDIHVQVNSLQLIRCYIVCISKLHVSIVIIIKVHSHISPPALLDNDDAMTTDSRTPNTTPPERRRENVSELSDVLNALQLVGRRNSQPVSVRVRGN